MCNNNSSARKNIHSRQKYIALHREREREKTKKCFPMTRRSSLQNNQSLLEFILERSRGRVDVVRNGRSGKTLSVSRSPLRIPGNTFPECINRVTWETTSVADLFDFVSPENSREKRKKDEKKRTNAAGRFLIDAWE